MILLIRSARTGVPCLRLWKLEHWLSWGGLGGGFGLQTSGGVSPGVAELLAERLVCLLCAFYTSTRRCLQWDCFHNYKGKKSKFLKKMRGLGGILRFIPFACCRAESRYWSSRVGGVCVRDSPLDGPGDAVRRCSRVRIGGWLHLVL